MTHKSSVSEDLLEILTPWFSPSTPNDSNESRWPSCFPPNLHPRVETINGRVPRRDFLPMLPFTRKNYVQFQSNDARIKQVLFEDTKNDQRSTSGLKIIHSILKTESDMYYSFGSCNSCYHLKLRNFADANKTPHPINSTLSCDDLPQIGLCGCIICNRCVRSVVNHPVNFKKDFVHCPYCGNARCFSRFFRIWAVTEDVYARHINLRG